MHLYLLRHGDAKEQEFDDASRPLTSLGEQQSRLAGKMLKKSGVVFDMILASPLLRAQQTAEFVQKEIGTKEVIVTEFLVPTSDHRQILTQINLISKETILVVGHEPHLSTFISILISGSRAWPVVVGKGSLACIEILFPLVPGGGTLKWLMTSDQIRLA